MSKNVEELDLYKEYKFAYDKAHELEFFDKVQEAQYYYEYAQQLKTNEAGRGHYETGAGGIGMKTYEGAILLKKLINFST